jgi:hypothetical protein
MTKTSLSSLYRRLTPASAAPALDAEDLVAVADGTLSAERRDDIAMALAASPSQAKLAHVLRDLKSDSEALAFGIARTERSTHRAPERVQRHVAAGRRFASASRWAGAMAACLVAVVGVFTLRQSSAPMSSPAPHSVARAGATSNAHDRIFSDADLMHGKAPAKGDELFRGDFSG